MSNYKKKIESYEDLEVYQKLCDLHIEVNGLKFTFPKFELYELGSQLRLDTNKYGRMLKSLEKSLISWKSTPQPATHDLTHFMGKRLFDIAFSMIGLILLLPLFMVVAILIKLDSKGPVFFKQKRMGRNFNPFLLYKFRSMVADAPKNGLAITAGSDPRITKMGRFLRKTKIDELPQLINVLKGNMSIVGPRPEVEKYVDMFRDDYQSVLRVKPGITDYATIEFRDEEGVLKNYSDPEIGYTKEVLPRKIELYKRYIKDKGFFTDMKLICLTLWKIVKK